MGVQEELVDELNVGRPARNGASAQKQPHRPHTLYLVPNTLLFFGMKIAVLAFGGDHYDFYVRKSRGLQKSG